MTISFADIEKCEDVELEFLSDEIEKYCGFITKKLYTYLKNKSKRI